MIKGWARPRGRQKKRPPREVATDPIGAELLSYAVKSPAEVNRIDLDRFLVETSAEQLGSRAAPVERLLRLAMVAVRCTETEAQPEGWLALKRICDRARQIAKREVVDVLVTTANLAGACASGRDEEPHDPDPVAVRIRRDAYAAVHEALSIEPDHEAAHEVLGRIAFEDPERDTTDALDAFLRAGSSPLVTYYVACCEQELGRFADALATYDRVDVGAFDRMGESWRREVFLENRAFCAWRAGDLERAEVEFRALVDRWEKDLSLALDAPLVSLVAAGAGPFRDSLGPRVRRLCVHVEDRGLVKLFDTLRQEHDSR
ncbi:MAG: hypothetical protein RIT81_37560 [Deltaproteobacteria bacterium]